MTVSQSKTPHASSAKTHGEFPVHSERVHRLSNIAFKPYLPCRRQGPRQYRRLFVGDVVDMLQRDAQRSVLLAIEFEVIRIVEVFHGNRQFNARIGPEPMVHHFFHHILEILQCCIRQGFMWF